MIKGSVKRAVCGWPTSRGDLEVKCPTANMSSFTRHSSVLGRSEGFLKKGPYKKRSIEKVMGLLMKATKVSITYGITNALEF